MASYRAVLKAIVFMKDICFDAGTIEIITTEYDDRFILVKVGSKCDKRFVSDRVMGEWVEPVIRAHGLNQLRIACTKKTNTPLGQTPLVLRQEQLLQLLMI